MVKFSRCWWFAWAALAWSSSAWASPFELYEAGARAGAMSGAPVASAQGPGAIFYNVAALAGSPTGIHGGLVIGADQTEILLMPRPAGYDVPDLGGSNPAVPTNATGAPADTATAPTFYALSLGAVSSLGVEKLRAGVLMLIPSDGFFHLKTHLPDERERLISNELHYTLIRDRVRHLDLQVGVAYELLPWLSVGGGGAFMVGAQPLTDAYIQDLSDQNEVEIAADVDTVNDWGLLLGARVDLPAGLSLGLSYRSESAFTIKGANRIRLGTAGEEDEQFATQELDWTPVYTPEGGALGLAWRGKSVDIEASGRYSRWSQYVDTHSNDAGFRDTLSPRLGAQWRYDRDLSVRAGLGWEPTPVPAQTGRTNYVDNQRVMASVGAGHRVTALGEAFEVNWAVQIQGLIPREQVKASAESYPACAEGVTRLCDEVPDDTTDPRTGQPYAAAQGLQTGNPGFPGYSSGGWMGTLKIEVAWLGDAAEEAK